MKTRPRLHRINRTIDHICIAWGVITDTQYLYFYEQPTWILRNHVFYHSLLLDKVRVSSYDLSKPFYLGPKMLYCEMIVATDEGENNDEYVNINIPLSLFMSEIMWE